MNDCPECLAGERELARLKTRHAKTKKENDELHELAAQYRDRYSELLEQLKAMRPPIPRH